MIVRIRKGLYREGKEAFLDINRGCLIILRSFLRGKAEDTISTSIDVYILPLYSKYNLLSCINNISGKLFDQRE